MTNLRQVPEHPELWCSEEGGVYRQHGAELRPLTACRLGSGYLGVTTSFGGKRKTLYVHRLVCAAFHGPPPAPDSLALHNDGDRLRNHQDNLRWGNHSDNQHDKKRHGRALTGEKNPAAKLTNLTAFAAKEAVLLGVPRKKVAQRYGVTVHTIGALVRGDTWNGEPGEVATCA